MNRFSLDFYSEIAVIVKDNHNQVNYVCSSWLLRLIIY